MAADTRNKLPAGTGQSINLHENCAKIEWRLTRRMCALKLRLGGRGSWRGHSKQQRVFSRGLHNPAFAVFYRQYQQNPLDSLYAPSEYRRATETSPNVWMTTSETCNIITDKTVLEWQKNDNLVFPKIIRKRQYFFPTDWLPFLNIHDSLWLQDGLKLIYADFLFYYWREARLKMFAFSFP